MKQQANELRHPDDCLFRLPADRELAAACIVVQNAVRNVFEACKSKNKPRMELADEEMNAAVTLQECVLGRLLASGKIP
jgi:hypothetical protein